MADDDDAFTAWVICDVARDYHRLLSDETLDVIEAGCPDDPIQQAAIALVRAMRRPVTLDRRP